jgi:hypothetical protein
MLTCDIGHETSSVNEAHNHSTTHSSAINFRDYRQSKEDNPEKLATYRGTQDEKKNKKTNTYYYIFTSLNTIKIIIIICLNIPHFQLLLFCEVISFHDVQK